VKGWLGHRAITSTAVYTAPGRDRLKDFWRDLSERGPGGHIACGTSGTVCRRPTGVGPRSPCAFGAGAARSVPPTSPPEPPPWKIVPSSAASWLFAGAGRPKLHRRQCTRNLICGPRSSPKSRSRPQPQSPPARSGPSFFSSIVAIRGTRLSPREGLSKAVVIRRRRCLRNAVRNAFQAERPSAPNVLTDMAKT
jgi:hypothetical protein